MRRRAASLADLEELVRLQRELSAHDRSSGGWLDAWRVRWYLGSLPLLPDAGRDLTDLVRAWLAQEAAAGRLVALPVGRYRLPTGD